MIINFFNSRMAPTPKAGQDGIDQDKLEEAETKPLRVIRTKTEKYGKSVENEDGDQNTPTKA